MPSEQSEATDLPDISLLDMDYDIRNEDDLLDQFSTDFDMLLPGDPLESKMALDNEFFDSLMKDEDSWPEILPLKSDLFNYEESCVKSEPFSPADSPGSLSSSESNSSSDVKFTLDTPPVSPPLTEFLHPTNQTNPSLPQDKKTTVLKINPKNIRIIQNVKGLKPVGKQTQVVLPKEILQKVINLKTKSNLNQPTKIIPISTTGSQIAYTKQLIVTSNKIAQQKTQPVLKSTFQTGVPTCTVPLQNPILPQVKQEAEVSKKNDLNIKALKRQQRMIKNRESACLSRKKKKEYVTSLESRLSDLEHENSRLKMENDMLKARIKELETGFRESGKSQFLNSNLRKTTAVFAVLLMVSLNIGSLSMLSRDVPVEFKQKSEVNGVRHGRALLWTSVDLNEEPRNTTINSKSPTCPLYINQTESLRLEEELRRWIAVDGGSERYRNSTNVNANAKAKNKPSLRQIILHSPLRLKSSKFYRTARRPLNALDVYRAQFPGSLPRRDDTFYVVSFSSDHLLIPALAHNNTLRPKMSFVIPTIPLNDSIITNGTIPMMQIDCEVLATRSIQFTEKDFKLFKPKEEDQRKDNNSAEVSVSEPSFKPYYLQKRRPKPAQDYDANFDSYLNRVYRAALP